MPDDRRPDPPDPRPAGACPATRSCTTARPTAPGPASSPAAGTTSGRPGAAARPARDLADVDYQPDAPTEILAPVDVFGLAAESPGVAGQPLAPWMTGEHQAIVVEEAPFPTGHGHPAAGAPEPAAPPPPART